MNTVHEEVVDSVAHASFRAHAPFGADAKEPEEFVDLPALCGALEGCLQRLKVLQHKMQEQETIEKALAAALTVARGAGRGFGAVLLHELLTKIETHAE
jgi:hypothetical protein